MWHYLNIHILHPIAIIPKKMQVFGKIFSFFFVAIVVEASELLQHRPVIWLGIVSVISLLLLFQPF